MRFGSAVEQGEFWEEGIAGASTQRWEGMETRKGGVWEPAGINPEN